MTSRAVPPRRNTGAQAARVIFIDLARSLAVLFMLYGHTVDALLAPRYRSGWLFDAWQFQRGLTSCLFLLLSGFAFSIATARHWPSHLTLSPALLKRVRRFALFVGLGYAMRVPVAPLWALAHAGRAEWQQLQGVDVLQLIGVTFLAVQGLVAVSRSRRVFSVAALGLAVLLVLSTPWLWTIDWAGRLPPWAAAYVSPAGGSQFPLVPWSAFILAGAALGLVYARWGAANLARYANLALLLPGFALAGLGFAATTHQVAWFGTGVYAWVPGNLFVRAGACLVLVGSMAHASRRIRELPHVFGAVAQESLLIYVLHLFIVFGSVWNTGILGYYGPTLTPLELLPIVVMLVSTMAVAAYGWNWLKHTHRRTARWTSGAVGGALLLLRLLLPF